MGKRLTADDFNRLFNQFQHEAFRLETRPVYLVEEEQETYRAFQAGRPRPITEIPFFAEWHEEIRRVTGEGRWVRRVRILDEPPTDYQRFEIWASSFNVAVGEDIRYLPRSKAAEIKLPTGRDWWLFDSRRLALMEFDPDGRSLGGTVTEDADLVRQHREWRDLAVRYATPDNGRITA